MGDLAELWLVCLVWLWWLCVNTVPSNGDRWLLVVHVLRRVARQLELVHAVEAVGAHWPQAHAALAGAAAGHPEVGAEHELERLAVQLLDQHRVAAGLQRQLAGRARALGTEVGLAGVYSHTYI